MGIDISEIKDYLDRLSRQLVVLEVLEHISEQLEEIKNLLIMISGKTSK